MSFATTLPVMEFQNNPVMYDLGSHGCVTSLGSFGPVISVKQPGDTLRPHLENKAEVENSKRLKPVVSD